jgi:hypothetical protein
MTVEIRTPDERTCLQCDRHETWDDAVTTWRVGDTAGEPFCVHDWNVTGSFTPVAEDSSPGNENDAA